MHLAGSAWRSTPSMCRTAPWTARQEYTDDTVFSLAQSMTWTKVGQYGSSVRLEALGSTPVKNTQPRLPLTKSPVPPYYLRTESLPQPKPHVVSHVYNALLT